MHNNSVCSDIWSFANRLRCPFYLQQSFRRRFTHEMSWMSSGKRKKIDNTFRALTSPDCFKTKTKQKKHTKNTLPPPKKRQDFEDFSPRSYIIPFPPELMSWPFSFAVVANSLAVSIRPFKETIAQEFSFSSRIHTHVHFLSPPPPPPTPPTPSLHPKFIWRNTQAHWGYFFLPSIFSLKS